MTGEVREIASAASDRALEGFYHPFAYAA